jgi:hypothetical protein
VSSCQCVRYGFVSIVIDGVSTVVAAGVVDVGGTTAVGGGSA